MVIRREKSLDKQPPTLLFYRPVELSPPYAEVAQLVEQRPEKPRVRSSILRLGTISSIIPNSTLVHSLSNNPNCNIFSPGNGTGYSPSKQAAQ